MSTFRPTEVLPRQGLIQQEDTNRVILCKPKLLPLKSVTLERLETMQREAQDKIREEKRAEEASMFSGMSSTAGRFRSGMFDTTSQDHQPDHGQDYQQDYGLDHQQDYGSDHQQDYGLDHQQDYGSDHGQDYGSDHGQDYASLTREYYSTQ